MSETNVPPTQTQTDTKVAIHAPNDGLLNIRLVDQQGHEIFFKIKDTTKLKKVFEAYYKKTNLPNGGARFIFDGNRIEDDSTAKSLGLSEGDAIDVMLQQTGGKGELHCFLW